jgi:uncharacterized protein
MKYLLVFAVVVVAFWFWRQGRQAEHRAPPPTQRPTKPLPPPTAMVACLQCGTHLPDTEAVGGRQGVYCCEEHRRLREGQGEDKRK